MDKDTKTQPQAQSTEFYQSRFKSPAESERRPLQFKKFLLILGLEGAVAAIAIWSALAHDDIGGAFFGVGILTVIMPATVIKFIARLIFR